MGNSEVVVKAIADRIKTDGRSVAWLARKTGRPYKRLLAEVKGDRPISLESAVSATEALGLDLAPLVRGREVA